MYPDFWESVIYTFRIFGLERQYNKNEFIENLVDIVCQFLDISEELQAQLMKQTFEELFSIPCRLQMGAGIAQSPLKENHIMKTMNIPGQNLAYQFSIDGLDYIDKLRIIQYFEKIMVFMFYKWQRYAESQIEQYHLFQLYIKQGQVLMYFNSDDELSFISNSFSQEFQTQNNIMIDKQSSLQFQDIFENCENIIKIKEKTEKNIHKVVSTIDSPEGQMLIQDVDTSNSWVIEFLPQNEQAKLKNLKLATRNKDQFYNQIKKTQNNALHNIIPKGNQNSERNKDEIQRSYSILQTLGQTRPKARSLIMLSENDMKPIPELDDLIDKFDFNIFNYGEKEKMRIVWSIFNKRNYLQTFNIPQTEFCNFLSKIREGYNKKRNSFHNFDHGVTVMQGCYMIGCHTRANKFLDSLQEFSLIFSGLCHDLKHTARTNAFEVNSSSKLALRYSDKSVLEQHHIATTFKIISNEEYNFLKNASIEDFQQIRKYVVKNILSTDISKHFKKLKQFEELLPQTADNLCEITPEQSQLLTGIVIHTADFHGNAQQFSLSSKWSYKVNEEFQKQYAEEEELNIPQTPYLANLDQPHILAKGEMGFIKFIVKPLWETLNKFLNNDLNTSVSHMEQNLKEWQKIHDEEFNKFNEAQNLKSQQVDETLKEQEQKQQKQEDKINITSVDNDPLDNKEEISLKQNSDQV